MNDNYPEETSNDYAPKPPIGIIPLYVWNSIIEGYFEKNGGTDEMFLFQKRMDEILTAVFKYNIAELQIPEKWDEELDELSEMCDEGYLQKYYSSRLILLKIPWLYNIEDDRKN